MWSPWKQSLLFRTIVVVIAVLSILSTMTLTYSALVTHERAHQTALNRLNLLIDNLETDIQTACSQFNRDKAIEVAKFMLSNHEVMAVSLSAKGQELVYRERKQMPNQYAGHFNSLSPFMQDVLKFFAASAPTTAQQPDSYIERTIFTSAEPVQAIGRIRLYANTELININAVQEVAFIGMQLIWQLVLVAIILIAAIMVLILHPIKALSDHLHKLDAPAGDRLSVPKGHAETEIGRLADDVNRLADNLVAALEEEQTVRLQREFNERKYHEIFTNAKSGIFLVDTRSNITSWNAAFADLFNVPGQAPRLPTPRASDQPLTQEEVEAMLLRPLPNLEDLPWANAALVRNLVQLADHNQDSLEEDLAIDLGEGRKRWLNILISPIDSNLLQGLVTDITERKNLLEAQEVARREADASNKAKSLFLANMSHEIRTPMNAIMGMAELCLATDLDPRQRNYLNKIKTATDTLLHIINDILDFSKIEAGKLAMESVPFNVDDVLDNLTNLIAHKAEDQKIELGYDVDIGGNGLLIGDPLRLGQILLNLLSNAVKFSNGGNVMVRVRALARNDREAELQFSVSDQGIGLTPEQKQSLFQAFNQADSSTTRRFGGTGLGLAISKRLCELMQGRIWVDSVYGQGSNFHFTARFGVQTIENKGELADMIENLARLPQRKVMVVDDNAVARLLAQSLLEKLGLEAECFDSALEALGRVNEPPAPDYLFCLIDFRMPEMDGLATLNALRTRYHGRRVPPMLLMTAHSRDEALQQGNIKFDGFLAKPLSAKHIYLEASVPLGLPALNGSPSQNKQKRHVLEDFRGADVLLVEDVDVNQEIITELLSNVGLRVRVANNGLEALSAVEKKRPDCILMDCQMPVMDGFEATLRLRADPRYQALPIIALTANAMAQDREMCLQVGMNAHLSKPINTSEMYAALAHWMQPQPAETAAVPTPPAQVNEPPPPTPESEPSLVLPGIDINTGVTNVGGKLPYFIKMLKKFRDGHGQRFGDDFRAALESGDRQGLNRLAHTLKGLARTLGATELGERCMALEHACKAADADAPDNCQTLLDSVMDELTRVLSGLAVLKDPAHAEV